MKSYTSIIVFFCAKKRPFWGFCALSVEPAVINGSVGGVVDGENEVYRIAVSAVAEIIKPVFRQKIAVACENAAFTEQNMENAFVGEIRTPVLLDEDGVFFACGEHRGGVAVTQKAAVGVLEKGNIAVRHIEGEIVLKLNRTVGFFRQNSQRQKAEEQSGEHKN